MAQEYVGRDRDNGVTIGQDSAAKVSFYGVAPVAQRAAAIQATSALSASSFTTVGSNLTAFVVEVANTLVGLGIWKGST